MAYTDLSREPREDEGPVTLSLQPGRYDLDLRRVWGPGGRISKTRPPPARPRYTPPFQCSTVLTVPVSLAPGANTLRVALPALHSLTVRGAVELVAVRRCGDPNFQCLWDADPSGVNVIDGLPDGEYWFFTGARSEKRQKVSVPSVSDIQF
jgi:hypothetical protein